MLSKQVVWVPVAWELVHVKVSCPDTSLYPEMLHIQVPDFAQALTAAHPFFEAVEFLQIPMRT